MNGPAVELFQPLLELDPWYQKRLRVWQDLAADDEQSDDISVDERHFAPRSVE
jgi:hypothetical protein